MPGEHEEKTILDVVYDVLSEELGDTEAARLLDLIFLRIEEELP